MFIFSWVIGVGDDSEGGSDNNPQAQDIKKKLDAVLSKSGSITIDVAGTQDNGPESLQVESENGCSIITLGESTEDDYVVRTFTNKSPASSNVSILGNEWDPVLVCEDDDLVKNIVFEFLTTGDVSRDLLS